MPSVWRWRLADRIAPDRRTVHAMISRWLDDDHHADRKPWSWTLVRGDADRAIDIALLDDTLVDRLITGAEAYRQSSMATPIRQVAVATWPQLAGSPAQTHWTMEFLSPVTFRRGQAFLPWPAPSSVFGSLRSSWRLFGAPHVGDVTLDLKLDPIVVSAMKGESQTERVVLRRSTAAHDRPTQLMVTGFTGSMRYAVDGAIDPSAVASLVALAPYAGVGAYTTWGFGAVRNLGYGK
ncbi:MAG TPA: CRISPR system precrRNA processing endoribonuclease RAMP protein Cas6 [Pseudonocardiaceae bacterium]|nr:CRISPR system precrRNA processing endoribonuclease RAMP protein Cas6 [Pseudonocardiaceae bacterium]